MSKIIKREGWRVEVTPEVPFIDNSEKAMESACKLLLAEIKRHCDFGTAYVQCDAVAVCSHCGYDWEAAIDEAGAPQCCGAAIAEHEAENPRAVEVVK